MRPRQSTTEIFSTFLQFENDDFSGWVTEPKLRRNMEACLAQVSEAKPSENFWSLYWHKRWLDSPESLAHLHLSAYLQEVCYWNARKAAASFGGVQYKLSDFFQLAIAQVNRVLEKFNPDRGSTLKTYASATFSSMIRDALRQQKEISISTDWALLRQLSQKRLVESLQTTGLSSETIDRYKLAWRCFNTIYAPVQSSGTRQLPRPDRATWDAIAQLYNTQRQTQLPPSTPECDAQTIEKWMEHCVRSARAYPHPQVTSLNAPKPGRESGEWQENLSENVDESLLDELIACEESETRQTQKTQLNTVLTEALGQLDSQAQTLLELYYQNGLTQKEIAQQLETKQYAISRRLTKTRESLLLTLAKWSQETLHISLNSNVLGDISTVLEEWLQSYYSSSEPHS